MTREDYKNAVSAIYAEMDKISNEMGKLRERYSDLTKQMTELNNSYAENSGFKVHDIVDVEEYFCGKYSKTTRIIIDSLTLLENYNQLSIIGRKIAKDGTPYARGKFYCSVNSDNSVNLGSHISFQYKISKVE